MKVYMPPEPRTKKGERRKMHQAVRRYMRGFGAELMQRPTGHKTMGWLQRAGAVVLETNAISKRDEAECIHAAQNLGKSVLVLFDTRHSSYRGTPSNTLLEAADKVKDPNTNLWLVRYSSFTGQELAPNAKLALDIFGDLYLGCKTDISYNPIQPIDEEADFLEALAAEERDRRQPSLF